MMTKKLIGFAAIAAGLLAVQIGVAQAPSGAPAGSTALCNDGTYFKGAKKAGACAGHKGIKTWYGTAAGTPASGAKPAVTPSPKSTPPPPPKPAATSAPSTPPPPPSSSSSAGAPKTTSKTMTQAAGGGPGLVWVNTASNVYHCPGTQYYGKTKAGAYMSEADAKAKGAHPVGGKPCGK